MPPDENMLPDFSSEADARRYAASREAEPRRWTMRDLRRFVAERRHVPDVVPLRGVLPEFPVHWARGNPRYENDLLGVYLEFPDQLRYETPVAGGDEDTGDGDAELVVK